MSISSLVISIIIVAVTSFLAGAVWGIERTLPDIEPASWYDDNKYFLPDDVRELCETYGWENIIDMGGE